MERNVERQEIRNAILVVFLAMGIIGVYGFPFMKGAFYNILKTALHLSDLQLGRIWSVFGVVGMLSYIGGGYFKDCVATRKILVLALSLSGVLHLYVSFVPNYYVLLVISGLMGIAAIFAFFPAASKVLNYIGSQSGAGGIFGRYYSLEGFGNLLITAFGTFIYMKCASELVVFTTVVRVYAVLNILAAICIHRLMGQMEDVAIQGNKVSVLQLKKILRQKKVWMIAVITMCNYMLFCSLTYITPYLSDVYFVTEEKSLVYAVVRIHFVAIFAGMIFGKIVDKKKSAMFVVKWSLVVNVVVLGSIIVNEQFLKMRWIAVGLTMVYSFVTTGVKIIAIVMISECEFSMLVMGSVIGLTSFIGYSPDAYLYSLVGRLLSVDGEKGYLWMFMLCICVAVIGVLCCRKLGRRYL